MIDDEIFYRIGRDVVDIGNNMFGVSRDITIWMTIDLFDRLFPEQFVLQKDYAMTTLFGCRIKVVVCGGMWWIVGYEGKVEDDETHDSMDFCRS